MDNDLCDSELLASLELDIGITELFSCTSKQKTGPTEGVLISESRRAGLERLGGRKKRFETFMLQRFIHRGNRSYKEEYLRCKLIRGHKKEMRREGLSSFHGVLRTGQPFSPAGVTRLPIRADRQR